MASGDEPCPRPTGGVVDLISLPSSWLPTSSDRLEEEGGEGKKRKNKKGKIVKIKNFKKIKILLKIINVNAT